MSRRSFLARSVIACALFTCTIGFAMAKAQAAPVAVPSPAAARFTVEVKGQGPDVILIPGLGSSSAVWDATVRQLEGRYRVHVLQVSGFAGAPAGANAEGPLVEPLVEALDGYIRSNRLRSPAVIGHSMGGLTGLILARRHPAEIGRLMIVDSLPFYAVLFAPTATVEAVRPQATMMRDAMVAMPADAFAGQQAMTMPRLVRSPEGQKAAAAWSVASDRKVFSQAFYDVLTTDMRGEVAAVTTPTTLLYPLDITAGQTAQSADQLYGGAYAALKGVRLARIDEARHFIMLDQPEAFAAQVEQFLN
jgi:pimeloyl-ACP methyl ester carboxylesterase